VLNLRVLVILSGIVGLFTLFGCDGLQGKIDRVNQAAMDIPSVCRQYGPDGSRPRADDFQQCKKDQTSYLFREEVESIQTPTSSEVQTLQQSEQDAGMMQLMPPSTPTPNPCHDVISGDSVYTIVVNLVGFWPWDDEGLPTGTRILVTSDFNGDRIREEKVFTEEMGLAALPGIFPGDEVCVAPPR
jgi:hypothetical protein